MASTKRQGKRLKKAREIEETADLDEMRELDRLEQTTAEREEKGETNPLDGAD